MHPNTSTRSLLIVFVSGLFSTLCLLGPPTVGVASAKFATNVGQVNGTPTTVPGGSVTIEVGLSQVNSSVSYRSCQSGPVELHLWSGGRWVYRTSANAWGCYGTPNSYGLARFPRKISDTTRRGTYLHYKFIYKGDVYHYGSVGYGSIYVR